MSHDNRFLYFEYSLVPIATTRAIFGLLKSHRKVVRVDVREVKLLEYNLWCIPGILPKIIPKLSEAAIFRLGIYRNFQNSRRNWFSF